MSPRCQMGLLLRAGEARKRGNENNWFRGPDDQTKSATTNRCQPTSKSPRCLVCLGRWRWWLFGIDPENHMSCLLAGGGLRFRPSGSSLRVAKAPPLQPIVLQPLLGSLHEVMRGTRGVLLVLLFSGPPAAKIWGWLNNAAIDPCCMTPPADKSIARYNCSGRTPQPNV